MAGNNRLVTTSFFGTVSASSKKTLVSKHITSAFIVKKIRASFAPGVNRLMKLYFFISYDPSAPTTEEPLGVNVLAQTGQVTYLTGEDEFKEIEPNVKDTSKAAYLKVYAVNDDTFEHTIDAQVTIEMLD